MIKINELRPAVEAVGLNAISMQEVLELFDRLEAAKEDRSNFLVEIGKLCAQCDALCLRIKAAEKERDALRHRLALESQENGALRDAVDRACEERDALRARIEAMEQQNPISGGQAMTHDEILHLAEQVGCGWARNGTEPVLIHMEKIVAFAALVAEMSALTRSDENSSTSPGERAEGQTASGPP